MSSLRLDISTDMEFEIAVAPDRNAEVLPDTAQEIVLGIQRVIDPQFFKL